MRYLLFGGEFYYAKGGGNDFIGSGYVIDDIGGAEDLDKFDWWHVFDTEDCKIVAASPSLSCVAEALEFDGR